MMPITETFCKKEVDLLHFVSDRTIIDLTKRDGQWLFIGDAPQLVVNLENQNNYILTNGRKLPYEREIALSPDLLAGKRQNVYETAIRHYYTQACQVAEGILIAEAYRTKANLTVRERKKQCRVLHSEK